MYRNIILGFFVVSILVSCSQENSSLNNAVPFQEIVVHPMITTSSGQILSWEFTATSSLIKISSGSNLSSSWMPDPACSWAYIIISDVRGTSMIPLYHDGDVIRYSQGYYSCYDVKRNDIIIYAFPQIDIIKRVVWIPWDTWKYIAGSIFINGKLLTNTEWKPYNIFSKMLELYAHSYSKIPKDTYLILGNQISGTLDSSRFGLISKRDIIGKVILDK